MKALVVDDEEDIRFITRLSLDRFGGMTVIEARSGAEGIDRAKKEKPDFILLDIMMPGMDGAATFQELQAGSETAAIPIVFLTAKSMAAEARRLIQLGAKGVLFKPFDPKTLAVQIRAILRL